MRNLLTRGATLVAALALVVAGAAPVAASGNRYVQISAGGDHTCAITSRGAAYCWGGNFNGALGDGTETDSGVNGPQPVIGGLKFVSLSAQEDFTCGLTTRGAAYCWGYNGSRGQLGDGTTTTASGVNGPQRVIGGHRFQALQVGSDGACGLTTRGQTYCWGDNSSDGELGDGTTTSSGVNGPQRVIGGIRFASFPVVSGEEHRCALTARGEAYCWGSNDSGQIGDGSGTGAATSELLAMGPRRVIGGLRFTSISVSEDRSCALTSSGAAYCWGDNFDGALGDGTTTDSDANGPQPVK
jgi:alpha-tubulin suppressor-like RCC1 family protein